jgi:hypothetical protein
MVADRDTAKLNLGGDFGTVVLRYPLAPLRRISKELGRDDGLTKIHEIVSSLSAETVAIFVWGGMLHDLRFRDLPLSVLREHLEWIPIPFPSLFGPVNEALMAVLRGEPDDEAEDKATEETPEAAEGKGPVDLGPGPVRSVSPLPYSALHLMTSGGAPRRRSSSVTSEGTQSSSSEPVVEIEHPALTS